jgi:flagellar motor switch protein FliN/FliY
MAGLDTSDSTLAAPAAGLVPRAAEDLELAERLQGLPAYSRSLLRVGVPVVVTLATTRRPVSSVIQLAPGAILQFSKPCDEPLTLSVGGCEVAVGETVKVGEKFGLRISSMLMPQEKFQRVLPRQGTRPD